MQQMIWRWKAWTNAKLFGMYCFSQFFTVLSQFRKWRKMYFPRNFYELYQNWANNIPLKSYGKCETFSCWWFSLIPSRFQVISKTTGSFVLLLPRNRFFENAPREEPELLGACTWTLLCFSRDFFARSSPSTARSFPSTDRNWASDIPMESCCERNFPVLIIFSYSWRFYKFFIWNSSTVVVELPAIFSWTSVTYFRL